MHILIAGGTGAAGRVLARQLPLAGHQIRIVARRRPADTDGLDIVTGDLTTGTGLDQAMADVDVVVDVSNVSTPLRGKASAFFTAATDHLFSAEQRAGVRHHLTLSIVGIDRFPSGYYRAKLDQEAAVVRASERTQVAHTIARVTQFHDFAALVYQHYRVGRLVFAPPLHAQPVHLRDVADHLLALIAAGPTGRARDLAGPQPEEVPDMVRRYTAAIRRPVRVLPAPLFGEARRANQAQVLRPVGIGHGTLTFDDWLSEIRQ
jgi:uncharacterized protein YbjT (DUF2867 family)